VLPLPAVLLIMLTLLPPPAPKLLECLNNSNIFQNKLRLSMHQHRAARVAPLLLLLPSHSDDHLATSNQKLQKAATTSDLYKTATKTSGPYCQTTSILRSIDACPTRTCTLCQLRS
jgi:hypothetical protein